MSVKEAFQRYAETWQTRAEFSPAELFAAVEPAFEGNGFRTDHPGTVQNILVIRLDAIGDMVLTTGFLRELRRNFPSARISMVTDRKTYSMVELCPYLNEVWAFDRNLCHGDFKQEFLGMMKFCEAHLWEKHCRMCLLPTWWGFEKADEILFAYMSGAMERVCYSASVYRIYAPSSSCDTSYEDALMTQAIRHPPEMVHNVDRCMHLLQAAGLTVQATGMELWYDAGDVASAARALAGLDGGCYVAVGLGAGEENRKYPASRMLEALQVIARAHPETDFVLLGGPSEVRDGQILERGLPAGRCRNLVGELGLRETAALLAECSLYLGNVTGVMHMAAAVGTPIITIFREAVDKAFFVPGLLSEYMRFRPWQANAIILRPKHALGACKDAVAYGGCKEKFPHCIAQVRPETIVRAFDRMMEKLRQTPGES